MRGYEMLYLQKETDVPLPGLPKNEQLSAKFVFLPGNIGSLDGKSR